MEVQSAVKSLSCIPCARRKVRCDRSDPCSHCKRRKEEDVCKFPEPNGSSGKAQPSASLIKIQQDRIQKLERYIIRSGGDLDQLQQLPTTGFEGEHSPRPRTPSGAVHSTPTHGKKRTNDGLIIHNEARPRYRPQACLVEHDKQTTYLEAPMWYSWSEAKKPGNESHESQQKKSQKQPQRNGFSTGYSATLLDPPSTAGGFPASQRHISPKESAALWHAYLTNVHPVVKIFFDWDKEPLMHKAAGGDLTALSQGQRALVFAIYFIAVVSLPEGQFDAIYEGTEKSLLLSDFQSSAELALRAADYAAATDLLVLQAYILYLLGVRNRAKPSILSSSMGIAVRMGERLGLHRDGSVLGLAPMQAEERRRTWWQMQQMEIQIGQLVGCLSITMYADWDTKLPANLEDDDIRLQMDALPPDRHGLTSMSHCLWRYFVLHLHRVRRDSKLNAPLWITTPHLSMVEKEAMMEQYKKALAEKFLQHCELVNPLHIHIQIGIHHFLLAMQRTARQPIIASTRISEMAKSDREDFLKISIKCMEYYVLGETTQSIAHLRWHNESYFQWAAFVYIIIEARHRAATPEAPALWTLIDKVCGLHPKLTTALECPEISAIGSIIVSAWQQRQDHLEEQHEHFDKPWCVTELEGSPDIYPPAPDFNGQHSSAAMGDFGSIDFDLIDWTIWENGGFIQADQDIHAFE